MDTRGLKILLEFRPSLRRIFWEAWYKANGLKPYEAMYQEFKGGPDKCYICGRQEMYLFNLVRLIPTYDARLKAIEYVCDDHGGEWWNCLAGEMVLFSTKPYWQRSIRNSWQSLILQAAIIIRYIGFVCYDVFMWYIAVWFYYWCRQCVH